MEDVKSHRKPKIRVAHLTPTYFAPGSVIGGGERYIDYLTHALRVADVIEMEQVVYSVDQKRMTSERNGIVTTTLPNVSLKAGKMNHIPRGLRRELETYDIIHIHQSLTGFGAYSTIVAAELQKILVMTDLGGGSSRSMLSSGLKLADGVLSISQYAKRLIESSVTGKHLALSGPIDTDVFCQQAVDKDANFQCLCVSRLLPHKGIDQVIRALPDGLGLKVVGQVYDERYFELLKSLAASKNVKFITDASDKSLVDLYNKATVFIQASVSKDVYGNRVPKSELMGLTTLEALACGTPSIVCNTGSLPELVKHTSAGRSYSSEEELGKILIEVRDAVWPKVETSIDARRHAIEQYSMKKVGDIVQSFYQQLLEAKKV